MRSEEVKMTKRRFEWNGKWSEAHSAFTLLELLVAIAVIGLLVAILVPSLSAVRERARQIQCVSNLKQIGTAFYLYADERGGVYPEAWNASLSLRWHDELLRYLYRAPSQPNLQRAE